MPPTTHGQLSTPITPSPRRSSSPRSHRLLRHGGNRLWENTADNIPRGRAACGLAGGRRCEASSFRLIARCRRSSRCVGCGMNAAVAAAAVPELGHFVPERLLLLPCPIATTLILAIGARTAAVAGTTALQWIFVKGFKMYSFQLRGLERVPYVIFRSAICQHVRNAVCCM